MPTERSDFSVVSYSDETPDSTDDALAVFGGYRTTWGYFAKTPKECEVVVTTTTTTTTTVSGEVITLTDPPDTTPVPVGPETTTLLDGGVQVVGTFDTLGNDQNPETSQGILTTTMTTTEDLQIVIGNTITSTQTATTMTSTIITTTTVTMTMTITQTAQGPSPAPGETTSTTSAGVAPTNPPVVSGSYDGSTGATITGVSANDTSAIVLREGPKPSCSPKYYFDDIWNLDTTLRRWSLMDLYGTPPPPRKGHTMFARKARSNDTQVVLFGGNNQDDPLNDLWILNVKRPGDDDDAANVNQIADGENIACHQPVCFQPKTKMLEAANMAKRASVDVDCDEVEEPEPEMAKPSTDSHVDVNDQSVEEPEPKMAKPSEAAECLSMWSPTVGHVLTASGQMCLGWWGWQKARASMG
ncbi:TNXB [Symbiodinium sp. CCMP2592]|nr:TNXB [Symbiodinium sp. CCMP2592]